MEESLVIANRSPCPISNKQGEFKINRGSAYQEAQTMLIGLEVR